MEEKQEDGEEEGEGGWHDEKGGDETGMVRDVLDEIMSQVWTGIDDSSGLALW